MAIADTGLKAYFIRHGRTAISPAPEGWQQIPIDVRGRRDAANGGRALLDFVHENSWPQPDRIYTSDLLRARQTTQIVSKILGVSRIIPTAKLRAFGPAYETEAQYEERIGSEFATIFGSGGVPLVVGHRSHTAWFEKKFAHSAEPDWRPDYNHYALCHEGGVLAIMSDRLQPIFKCYLDHFPPALPVPSVE